jgi:translation initiation factor 6 (eIF-6)
MLLIPISPEVVNIRPAILDSSLIDNGVVVSMSDAIRNEQHLIRSNISNPNRLMVSIGNDIVIPEELRLILKQLKDESLNRLEDKLNGKLKHFKSKKLSEVEAKELEMVDDLFLTVLLHQDL